MKTNTERSNILKKIRERRAKKLAEKKAKATPPKSVTERVLGGEGIRNIVLDESPYPGSMKKDYPAGGDLGVKKDKAIPEHPTSGVDIKPAEDKPKGPFTRDSKENKSLPMPSARRHNTATGGKGKQGKNNG